MADMRRDITKRLITSMVTILLAAGMGLADPAGPVEAPAGSTTQPASQPSAPAHHPAELIVLVRLGDRSVVTQADVDAALSNDRPERFESIKESVVNRLVDDRIWDLYLADHPEMVKEEDIDRQLENQVKRLRLKSIGDLEKRLHEREGVTLEEQRQRLRRKRVIGQIVQNGLDKGKKDEDLQAIYDANPDHFNSTLVSARQIILRSPCWDTFRQREEKRSKLNKIREDLISGARTWDECMAESDVKLPNGGRMNSFKRYEIAEDLAKAAFALEPGQYSQILETPLGFHLLQVTHRKQGTNRLPNPQVRQQILRYLQNEAIREARESVLSKAPIIGVQPPCMPELMRIILSTRPAETQPAASPPSVPAFDAPVDLGADPIDP